MLTKVSDLLAIAKHSLTQLYRGAGLQEIVSIDDQLAIGEGVAEIWRHAQRRRGEYLGLWFRQVFHGAKTPNAPNAIEFAVKIANHNVTPQSEHAHLAIDSKSGFAAKRTLERPDRTNLAARATPECMGQSR